MQNMELLMTLQTKLPLLLLLFARVSGIFSTAPFFSSRNIPVQVKAGLSAIFTLLLLPLIDASQVTSFSFSLPLFAVEALKEVIIGMAIGFIASLFFQAVQMSGQFLDTQIGFGIVNILDVQSGQQMPLMGNFQYILALLLFLITDMHHVFIHALFDSYRWLPLLGQPAFLNTVDFMISATAHMFVIAFQLAMPVIMVTMLSDIALGILARTMPQLNIFVVGIPLKIALGIFMMALAMPAYVYFLKVGFHGLFEQVYRFLQLAAG